MIRQFPSALPYLRFPSLKNALALIAMIRPINCRIPKGWIVWLVVFPITAGWAQSPETLRQQANTFYRKYPKQPDETIRLFQEARQQAIQQRQFDVAANCCVDEATVHYNRDDNYFQAATVCRIGLQFVPLMDSTRFKLWASLGEMYHQQERPDSVAYCWQQADRLLTAHPILEGETRAYVAAYWGNRGTAWLQQGDYPLAERCFQKRLLLVNRRDPNRVALAENQIATFYLVTHQLARADSLFGISLRHYTGSGLERGWYLLSHLDCRLERGLPDLALPLLWEAQAIARREGADGRELTAYLEHAWGKYWNKKKQYQKARASLLRSLQIGKGLQQGEKSEIVWRSWMALSRLARQQGQHVAALQFAQQAIIVTSVRFQNGNPTQNPAPADFLHGPHLFESLTWKAHLLRLGSPESNQLELSRQTYEGAFALSTLLQESYSSDLTKLFFQDKLRPAYREALAVAWLCYRQNPHQATLRNFLRLQQQSNGTVLGEMLQTLRKPYRNAPTALLEKLQRAKKRLVAAKTRWVEQSATTRNGPALTELINTELNWSRAYQQLCPYALLTNTLGDPLTRLQQRLDTNSAFLHYSLTSDSLLLTITRPRSIRVLALPLAPAQLDSLVGKLRAEAARNPDPFQYAGARTAQQLYAGLIAPVLTELKGIRRLVIVRDGSLHFVPFEVLETGRRPSDYLLRYQAITYAYSARSFAENPLREPTRFPSLLSMAPFTVEQTTYRKLEQQGYKPLEGSGEETSHLADTRVTAGNAGKHTFLSLIGQHELAHLATHAQMDDNNPGASFIAFFPDGDSHRLYAHELNTLDLRHLRLSVLTGCHTGAGNLHQSEGLLSVGRAFATAGCLQVITSIWDTHDGTTATISWFFYEALRQGHPTDFALQQAKLRFLDTQTNGGAFGPPHFWAHLVLMGDHQAVYAIPLPMSVWAGVGSVVLLLLGTGVWLLYWRKTR